MKLLGDSLSPVLKSGFSPILQPLSRVAWQRGLLPKELTKQCMKLGECKPQIELRKSRTEVRARAQMENGISRAHHAQLQRLLALLLVLLRVLMLARNWRRVSQPLDTLQARFSRINLYPPQLSR